MDPHFLDLVLNLIIAIGVVANLYMTLNVKNAVLGTKLWVSENFVAKRDLRHNEVAKA
jgi:hypothetical protein